MTISWIYDECGGLMPDFFEVTMKAVGLDRTEVLTFAIAELRITNSAVLATGWMFYEYEVDLTVVACENYSFDIVAKKLVGFTEVASQPGKNTLVSDCPTNPPGVIQSITCVESSFDTITIEWDDPSFDGNSPIQTYDIKWSTASDTGSISLNAASA